MSRMSGMLQRVLYYYRKRAYGIGGRREARVLMCVRMQIAALWQEMFVVTMYMYVLQLMAKCKFVGFNV